MDDKEKLNAFKNALADFPKNKYFKINRCLNVSVPNTWNIHPRRNDDMHLLFVIDGSGYYEVEGKIIELSRGRVIFLSSRVLHKSWLNHKKPLRIIPVRFDCYDNASNIKSNFVASPLYFTLMAKDIEMYHTLFQSLYENNLQCDCPFRSGFCSTLTHNILSNILLDTENRSSNYSNEDSRIIKVKRYIAQNPLDRSSIYDLAKMAGLSKKYFSKLFKQEVGMTPKSYQLSARLNRAKFLLEESDMTIQQVAFHLDYPDPYLFSKQFKKHFGISPSRIE